MHYLCGGAGRTPPRKLPSLAADLIRCRGGGKVAEPGLNSSPGTERRSALQQLTSFLGNAATTLGRSFAGVPE